MSVSERLQFAKDLAREREYRSARGVAKGALSGATLGLSEKIPGLKPEEGEFMVGFGEFLGSALPISKLYNYLGKPLVTLAAKSPIAAKGLQSLARMTGFGLTGASYETGKEVIKTGEVPSASEVAKYGAEWAAFDGALQLFGKAASSIVGKLGRVAEANNVPEREILNNIMDTLKERKIDIENDPKKAIGTAQEILDNYPRKMQSAREERITALKEKAETAEKKATEPFEEKRESLIAKQKEMIEGRKEAVQKEEQSFDTKKQALNEKIEAVEARGSERLERLSQKEGAITQKFEEQNNKAIEQLRRQSDKEIDIKSREAEKKISTYEREIGKQESKAQKEITAIDRQIEKAKENDAPTKRLENMKASIRAQADRNIDKLKTAIETQNSKLDAFRDKSSSTLENKIDKLEAKQLPSSERQKIDRELSEVDRDIAKEKKIIQQSEQLLAKEKDRRVAEIMQEAQGRLQTLQQRKAELETGHTERLKALREKAYAERNPERKVTVSQGRSFSSMIAQPIVETTGQGAGARIEYPKKGMSKVI
ncbi:MAG: hypothetical protein JSR46_08565, partial [Verrucomicrobia bacterium]|nr:hypothetical protein [Verrucomicrobiota bacterium]